MKPIINRGYRCTPASVVKKLKSADELQAENERLKLKIKELREKLHPPKKSNKLEWRYSADTGYWYYENSEGGWAHILDKREGKYLACVPSHRALHFTLLRDAKKWIEEVVAKQRQKRKPKKRRKKS